MSATAPARRALPRPVLATASAIAVALMAAGCGPCEQSDDDKKADAEATVSDFISEVRAGDYEAACSLFGLGDVNGGPGPRQRPGWATACRDRYLPRGARDLAHAKVAKAVDFDADAGAEGWPEFPFADIAIYEDDAWDVDTAAVTVRGAPKLEKKLKPNAFHDLPAFGVSNYEGVDGGCGREWCITLTPLGPFGKP